MDAVVVVASGVACSRGFVLPPRTLCFSRVDFALGPYVPKLFARTSRGCGVLIHLLSEENDWFGTHECP